MFSREIDSVTQRPLLFPFRSCIALSLASMASGFPTQNIKF
ncbi:hypothetical protein SynBIOSE41_02370 [Synechococcus sp. BIOS-E4-1]|nr:hypothetical protein SynBIOSE41_02370 [Synechococcus sp. BIOS-E4-1]